mgnify:CR=1 FL=1
MSMNQAEDSLASIYGTNDNQTQNQFIHFQPQEAVALEEELQRKIDLSRQETKHLYNQIDKVKSRAHDANLLDTVSYTHLTLPTTERV